MEPKVSRGGAILFPQEGNMKKWLILPAVLILTLVTTISAFADAPYQYSYKFDGPPYALLDCGKYGDWEFWIWDYIVGKTSVTEFYDESGNPIEMKVHSTGIDTWYNPLNPDKVATGYYSVIISYFFDPGTGEWVGEHGRGNNYSIQLPHEGNFYHVTGTYFLDEFGYMQVGLLEADKAAACEYFAP
jgi:hypothetical protein